MNQVVIGPGGATVRIIVSTSFFDLGNWETIGRESGQVCPYRRDRIGGVRKVGKVRDVQLPRSGLVSRWGTRIAKRIAIFHE